MCTRYIKGFVLSWWVITSVTSFLSPPSAEAAIGQCETETQPQARRWHERPSGIIYVQCCWVVASRSIWMNVFVCMDGTCTNLKCTKQLKNTHGQLGKYTFALSVFFQYGLQNIFFYIGRVIEWGGGSSNIILWSSDVLYMNLNRTNTAVWYLRVYTMCICIIWY
jgi:hypothetical protein